VSIHAVGTGVERLVPRQLVRVDGGAGGVGEATVTLAGGVAVACAFAPSGATTNASTIANRTNGKTNFTRTAGAPKGCNMFWIST
jgi:hypothetical protein